MAEGKGWNGKYAGQAQRWFFFRFTGDDSEVNLQAHEGHAPEFAEWRWAAFDEALLEEVVPFKRRVYEAVLRHFRETVAPATPAL